MRVDGIDPVRLLSFGGPITCEMLQVQDDKHSANAPPVLVNGHRERWLGHDEPCGEGEALSLTRKAQGGIRKNCILYPCR
jgi:hypothetical protein